MIINDSPLLNKVRYYSSFIMIVVYLAFGALLLFTDIAINIVSLYRTPLGITMLVYGTIRTTLTIRKNKNREGK